MGNSGRGDLLPGRMNILNRTQLLLAIVAGFLYLNVTKKEGCKSSLLGRCQSNTYFESVSICTGFGRHNSLLFLRNHGPGQGVPDP